METTCYLIIIVFLLVLAVVDLFVGVSNDAVNFMNSAIGAKSYAVGGDDGCGAARHYATVVLLVSRGDDAVSGRDGDGCDCA